MHPGGGCPLPPINPQPAGSYVTSGRVIANRSAGHTPAHLPSFGGVATVKNQETRMNDMEDTTDMNDTASASRWPTVLGALRAALVAVGTILSPPPPSLAQCPPGKSAGRQSARSYTCVPNQRPSSERRAGSGTVCAIDKQRRGPQMATWPVRTWPADATRGTPRRRSADWRASAAAIPKLTMPGSIPVSRSL
jgi:hypothetical protein